MLFSFFLFKVSFFLCSEVPSSVGANYWLPSNCSKQTVLKPFLMFLSLYSSCSLLFFPQNLFGMTVLCWKAVNTSLLPMEIMYDLSVFTVYPDWLSPALLLINHIMSKLESIPQLSIIIIILFQVMYLPPHICAFTCSLSSNLHSFFLCL